MHGTKGSGITPSVKVTRGKDNVHIPCNLHDTTIMFSFSICALLYLCEVKGK